MFISTAQNTCSRDNTVTANKTATQTEMLLVLRVSQCFRLKGYLASVRCWVTRSHKRNTLKSAH